MDELANIIQTKYESKKNEISKLFSKKVCDEIEEAYKKTVLCPVTIGTDSIDMEAMKECSLLVLFYVNKESDMDYDDLISLDMSQSPPLIDVISRDKAGEYNMVKILEADQKSEPSRRAEGLYMLKELSDYLENNNLETHCVFKLPDLTDQALYTIAYNN